MKRARRKARQVMPKISKKGESEENEIYIAQEETDEPISEVYEKEDAHSRVISKLHDAVQRWKEEKDLPEEEREPGAITKIFKKIFKKDKNNEAEYNEVKKFLSKISSYDPEETEDINLDNIKKEVKEEQVKKHEKSIIGEKLEIEQKEIDFEKEKQKLEKIREEKQKIEQIKKEKEQKYLEKERKRQETEEIKQRHKEEIQYAIKKHHIVHEKEEPAGIVHKRKHLDIIEEDIKEEIIPEKTEEILETKIVHKKKKIEFDKVRQTVNDKMKSMHTKLKENIHKIKGKMHKPKELKEYPEKYIKEEDNYKERERYFPQKAKKEKHEQKIVTTQKLPRPKHEIDSDIEKIYKEIEQLK